MVFGKRVVKSEEVQGLNIRVYRQQYPQASWFSSFHCKGFFMVMVDAAQMLKN